MAEFKDHFSSRSADYARFRPTYPLALAAYLGALAPSRELALDCGCGAGQLSVLLGDVFDQVAATDASAQQIENAKPHPNVIYRAAPAETSGLADQSADLITVAQAAHWFDLDVFYTEVRRILKPGGVIALITYGVTVTDGPAGEALSDFYTNIIGPYWPPERRHVEEGYRGLPFPFDEFEAEPLAMRADWTLDQLLGYVDTWSAVRGAEKALGRAPYEEFATRLAACWGDPDTPHEIRWPLSFRLGRV